VTTSTTAPAVATRASRTPGVLCAIAGVAFIALGILGMFQSPEAHPALGLADPWMAVTAVAIVLSGLGIWAAGRVGDVTGTVLGRVGLGAALLGTAVFTMAHLVAALVPGADDTPLFPLGEVVAAVGMIVLGVAVVRRGHWDGVGRYTPLVCGLYPFVILMPAFAIFGEPNFPAIAGFGIPWILLGLAVATPWPSAVDSTGPEPLVTRRWPHLWWTSSLHINAV